MPLKSLQCNDLQFSSLCYFAHPIDLNDSGIAFWTDGEVVTISVGRDTDFESVDWFAPDTKVIISHH